MNSKDNRLSKSLKAITDFIDRYLFGEVRKDILIRAVSDYSVNEIIDNKTKSILAKILKQNIKDINEADLLRARCSLLKHTEPPKEELKILLFHAKVIKILKRYLRGDIIGDEFVNAIYEVYLHDDYGAEIEDYFASIDLYVSDEVLRSEDPLYFGEDRLKKHAEAELKKRIDLWQTLLNH